MCNVNIKYAQCKYKVAQPQKNGSNAKKWSYLGIKH